MKFSSIRLYFNSTQPVYANLNSVTFPVDSSILTSPYVLKSVDGLDPPEVNVLMGDTIADGGLYLGRRPQNREIVLSVGFAPNYVTGQTSETLRNQLYPFMAPKVGLPVTLGIQDGSGVELMSTTGHIKRMEANPFSKTPEVAITLSCFDTYFVSKIKNVANPTTISGNPFLINNSGTAPTGFNIQFKFNASAPEFNISDGGLNAQIAFTFAFNVNDVVTISTIVGHLTAQLKRGATFTNLLPYISSSTKWIQLHAGDNYIYVVNPSSWTINSISYTPKYWGV